MRTSCSVVLLVFVNVALLRPNSIPYISPGIGISWNFSGRFIISPKVSFGVYQNRVFYNVTVGHASSSENQIYPHFYLEFQAGVLTPPSHFRKLQMFYGGGVGLTFPTASKRERVSFRVSAFTGYIVFANVNFLLADTLRAEVGGQLVLPIPLNSEGLGPGG